MARRLFEYALIATVLCLVPSMFWSEWTVPPTAWSPDRDHAMIAPWQARLFVGIVGPPAWLNDRLRLGECAYGCAAGVSWCREIYVPPPTVAAVEFARIGGPFWGLVLMTLGEGAVWMRRR